ncbi:FxsA family membrane protein [Streptomyces sp. 6N223]|uniref:FxsA family membrane protein n=1 Tax=Streptomyces sp. 6N223 TaxID=3457412 RepID=UPI003FD6A758
MTTGSPDSYRTHRRPGDGRRAPRRRGPRALLPLGIAAWVVLEIWLLALLGDAAGGLTVFLVLVAGVVLGAAVIRRAGRRAWRRLAASLQPGAAEREPEPRGGSGLTMLGGLLLMVPGLASDALGLLCVFPPTAALLRRAGARYLSEASGPLGVAFREARQAEEQRRVHRTDGKVVQGEVVRDEDRDQDREDRDEDRPGGQA